MTEETKSITTDYVVDETAVNLAKKKKRRLWTLLGVSTFLLAGGVVAYIMYQSGLAYKNAIPEDAPIVLEIDVRSIFAKSVMESYETKIADLIESVDPENVDLKNITESLTKKENTGISFFYPLYAFTDSSVENVFILASVSDKTDLINTIKSLDVDVHIYDSSNEISWIEVGDDIVGGITEDALLIGSTDSKSTYEDLLTQEKAQSFFASDAGKFMDKHTEDITLMINYKNIYGQLKRELKREINNVYALDELPIFVASLEFEAGDIILEYHVDGIDEEVVGLMEDLEITEEVFDHIPTKNLIGFAALPIDGPKALEKSQDKLRKLFGSNDDYKKLKKLLNATSGTAVVAVYNNDSNNEPDVLCIIPTSKSKLKSILEDELPSYINIDGDDKYTSITSMEGYRYSSVSNSFDGDINSSYLYGIVYLKQHINKLLDNAGAYYSEMPDYQNKVIELLELIDSFEIKCDDIDEASMTLRLTNDSKNSLELLLEHSIQIGEAYIEYINEMYSYDTNDYDNYGNDYGYNDYDGSDYDYYDYDDYSYEYEDEVEGYDYDYDYDYDDYDYLW
ncbi:MAG: DUF4836 family protein [Paludibacteraceae bacterium]|nr:DUF4836 family protein [Paludibacteraceae bacterium]